ncbi:MAG: threonine synthase [Cardiobacteriaceae bacterium]|nr:threonine synthase [Cardiobacteriaceae bacterium]
MQYQSTRGSSLGSFSDILLSGLAPDGGLAMPVEIPQFSRQALEVLRPMSYAKLAHTILSRYIDDIDSDTLKALCQQTYRAEVFHSEAITPLTYIHTDERGNRHYLLELSNGPSLAFKDMALQLLGHLFEHTLHERKTHLNILGATSGDTGSAAEYAMLGKKNVNVFMLSPHERMSPFQQAQMYGLDEPNIFNIAVKGVFDDCQDLVKVVNQDADFKALYHIGAVNSINWARVLAQSVYYFKAWLSLDAHEEADFVVPSGNFGNIFAGFLAKKMGLPIGRLIVASNENDVLHEFFQTGIYRPRPAVDVHETSSPSMDIGKASNFERYLYALSDGDATLIKALWQQLDSVGSFDLKKTNKVLWAAVQASGFGSYRSNHAERLQWIRHYHQSFNRLIDPHTADGAAAAFDYAKGVSNRPIITLETALPAKFNATMVEAIGFDAPRPKRFEGIEALAKKVSVMENDVEALKAFMVEKLS